MVKKLNFQQFRQSCPFHDSKGYCDNKGNAGRRTHGKGKAICNQEYCPFKLQFKGEFD